MNGMQRTQDRQGTVVPCLEFGSNGGLGLGTRDENNSPLVSSKSQEPSYHADYHPRIDILSILLVLRKSQPLSLPPFNGGGFN